MGHNAKHMLRQVFGKKPRKRKKAAKRRKHSTIRCRTAKGKFTKCRKGAKRRIRIAI